MKTMCRKVIENIVKDMVSPGVVVLATAGEKVICDEAFGTTGYNDSGSLPVTLVTKDMLYDIASISKIVTATGILILVDRNAIFLDDLIIRFFAKSSYGQQVSIRHLLTHTSGIGIQMSILSQLDSTKAMHNAIMQAPLITVPGREVMFTNINSYLLGKIIERVSRQSLDKFLFQEIFRPLGMTNTLFNPPEALKNRIAPTERTKERGLIHGQVHDPSAYALGGIVGHAGLFSTAEDLHKLCRLWLQDGVFQDHRLLSTKLVREAIKNQAPAGSPATGFGWMLDRPFMGSISAISYGHTAFTGPSIVITPKHNLIVVMLTNRLYPRLINNDRHVYNAELINYCVVNLKK